jgi:CIC family chloride channel protein
VGSLAHTWFPHYTATPGAYALVGMGAAFAGIVRSPLTSVIMIFEVTRDYSIIVPLMISNLIAFFISQSLQKEPIYEALAHQDGVHLPGVQSRSAPARIQVRQAMRAAPDVLTPDEDVATALGQVTGGLFEAWPVAGQEGLWGMVRNVDLEEAVRSGPPEKTLAEMLGGAFPGGPPDPRKLPHVHPDHNLSIALERMGSTGLHALPVVSRANVRVLLGIVLLEDVLGAYGVRKPAGQPISPAPE